MKKFERLTGNQREQTQQTLDDFVSQCTPDQIEKAKKIFWETAEKAGGREKYQQLEPKMCDAFEALPDTEKFREINEMYLEVSVDIIKRALGKKK